MNKKIKRTLFIVLCFGVVTLAALYLRNLNVSVLNPQGIIAEKQRNLIMFAALLSLVVVVPVFAMTIFITMKYRVGNTKNTKARYTPGWDHNHVAETVWWLLPTMLIVILSIVTFKSSHDLDPYKTLSSSKKPLTIQVVALEWKWLFIYPEQHVASVNFFQIPANTPINFEITSDAPMNSFWIPQLGGQVYAMSGMKTQLHLMAGKPGEYRGSSANISGDGFADMKFIARAGSQADFDAWVKTVRQSPGKLTQPVYDTLALPSKNNPRAYYASAPADLYDTIVMKYLVPEDTTSMEGMDHGSH